MNPTPILHAAVLLTLSVSLSAHRDHGEIKTMSGTLVVEAERMQIDVFDRGSFSQKRVWVILDDHTRIESGKTRLTVSDLHRDQEIDCMAGSENGPYRRMLSRAILTKSSLAYVKPGGR